MGGTCGSAGRLFNGDAMPQSYRYKFGVSFLWAFCYYCHYYCHCAVLMGNVRVGGTCGSAGRLFNRDAMPQSYRYEFGVSFLWAFCYYCHYYCHCAGLMGNVRVGGTCGSAGRLINGGCNAAEL